MSSKWNEAEVGGAAWFSFGLLASPFALWVEFGAPCGADEMLDMLTRLLVLASLPLRLLELGGCEDGGTSNGFVLLVGGACGRGSTERLVRGPLEGVAPVGVAPEEGVAGSGVGRSRWWPPCRGEDVRKGGGGGDVSALSCGAGGGGGARDFLMDSKNIFSAAMQEAGSSCNSFLAAWA